MNELTHISLFTGIGGIDLAAEWAGFETVLMVENNPYCQKVLKKQWPDVPILEDIYNVNKETIQEAMANAFGRGEQQSKGDIPEGRGWTSNGGEDRNTAAAANFPITLITGGFPCQPVSHAGKRRGKEDDRWLWPEMLRVISEVRPTWVVAENVTGLLTMGFYDCLSDLEGEGYETQAFVIPACGVNAPHRRDRIFIVAHAINSSDRGGRGQSGEKDSLSGKNEQALYSGLSSRTSDVANTEFRTERTTHRKGSNRGRTDSQQDNRDSLGNDLGNSCISGEEQWSVEPELGRVAYGIPHRVDRLRALGNAVVPQQIYPILKAIADIERNL